MNLWQVQLDWFHCTVNNHWNELCCTAYNDDTLSYCSPSTNRFMTYNCYTYFHIWHYLCTLMLKSNCLQIHLRVRVVQYNKCPHSINRFICGIGLIKGTFNDVIFITFWLSNRVNWMSFSLSFWHVFNGIQSRKMLFNLPT